MVGVGSILDKRSFNCRFPDAPLTVWRVVVARAKGYKGDRKEFTEPRLLSAKKEFVGVGVDCIVKQVRDGDVRYPEFGEAPFFRRGNAGMYDKSSQFLLDLGVG